jgi:hypothetical protein
MSLTVWPIKLVEPGMPMGMFITYPMGDYLALETDKEAYWQAWKQVLEDAKAHGVTSLDPSINMPLLRVENGKAVVDFKDMDRFMELAKAAGFKQTILGYAIGTGFGLRPQVLNGDKSGGASKFGLKTYGEMIKVYFDALREHGKEKGYLPIAFASDDEYLVHADSTIEQCEEYHRALKENAPDFRFIALDTIYPDTRPQEIPQWEKMMKSVDGWGAGGHTPKVAEIVKKAGSRLWLYNTGPNRFVFGTYMFYVHNKWDVQGFWQWVYPTGGTYTIFDLCSHNEGSYGVVYPSTHGLRTTPIWERIRAGCDDHRYLQTAAGLIEQAKKSGKGTKEAEALQKLIDQTLAKITFGNPNADAISGEGKADSPMDAAQMETFRKNLAEGIVNLQTAMK